MCSCLRFLQVRNGVLFMMMCNVQSKSAVEAVLGRGEVTARLPVNQIPVHAEWVASQCGTERGITAKLG